MKNISILSILAFTLSLLFSSNVNAQSFPALDKSPMDIASFPASPRESNKLIKIAYSRPQLKGRVLDSLAPKGKVWRTGANESAEITLYVDMKLGDTPIKAGTYSLATIPGDKEWTVIINSDLNAWGSYFYKEENDVARLSVPLHTSETSLEAFSMVFSEVDDALHLNMGWGNMRIAIPFTKQ